MVFNNFATLAQFVRRLIQERSQVGQKAANARGQNEGGPKISSVDPTKKMAGKLSENKSFSISAICTILKISQESYYQYLVIEK